MIDDEAREKLDKFIRNNLENYSRRRNFDENEHENVSRLSPYIRYRIITEEQVIRAALDQYPYPHIQKFVDEVFWRTYWKGWLEQRPVVWQWYKDELSNHIHNLPDKYFEAVEARTEIDCFNHWVKELKNTGYLHNHARMWFASIWIFSLKLPWQLGADFFLQNLLDGDAASNTLSWRWVAGLQTKGKHYLATGENIEKYTHGRFSPRNLDENATTLNDSRMMPEPAMPDFKFSCSYKGRIGLLITEEDARAEQWMELDFAAIAALNLSSYKSPLGIAKHVNNHVNKILQGYEIIDDIKNWKSRNNLDVIITAFTPQGHVNDFLKNYNISKIVRTYDAVCWPHATKGFFKFKKSIPDLISELNLD